MKRFGCIFAITATSVLGGCSALDFEIDREIPEQRVRGSLVSGLLDGVFESPVPVDVDISRETEAMDAGPASAVRLTHLSLEVTETAREPGDVDDFDFLDSVEVFVESSGEGTSLPRVRAAVLDPVPPGATRIELEPDRNVDLLPYVEEGALLTSEASGTAPPDDVTFDGRLTLLVEVL